ncbi:MAG: nucleotide exchange factor GrpE [bacterium]|nr:nucleotide exchange factor GrpE [bacterium]
MVDPDKTISSSTVPQSDTEKKPEPEKANAEVMQEPKHKPKLDKREREKLEKKIAELEAIIADKDKVIEELKDKWLRTTADFDNFRKRINKEKAEWREFAHEEILEEILPVLDNFDRALAAMLTSIPNEYTSFSEGMQLVYKQFIDILTKHNITQMECVGKPFNPQFHEAVMVVPTAEFPEDTVIEEIRKGYLWNDKVIRPAMVKVSKMPVPGSVEPSKKPIDIAQNEVEID